MMLFIMLFRCGFNFPPVSFEDAHVAILFVGQVVLLIVSILKPLFISING